VVSSRRREFAAVVAASLTLAALFIADARWRSVLGVPRNDDWSYYRTLFTFHDTGVIDLHGWTSTFLLGQVFLAVPLIAVIGHNVAALQVVVSILGAAALVGTWWLLRQFLSALRASMCCACAATGPLYGNLSVSFMTEVPAFAAQVAVLILGYAAVRDDQRRTSLLWATSVLGLLAFSIREYSILAAGVVFVVVIVDCIATRQKSIRNVGVVVACHVAAVALLLLWRRTIPLDNVPVVALPAPKYAALQLTRLALTIGFFISPVAMLLSPTRLASRAGPATTALVVGACVMAAATAWPFGPFIGNYFGRTGSYPAIAGSPAVTIPTWAWVPIVATGALGVAAALLVGVATIRTARPSAVRRHPAAVITGGFAAVSMCVYLAVATVSPFFDRYLLSIVAPAAAIVLFCGVRTHVVGRSVVGVVYIIGFATLGLAMVDHSAAYDGARWRAGERAVIATGRSPDEIDAGFEWYSAHQEGHDAHFRRGRSLGQNPWTAWWDGHPCVTVTTDAPPGAIPLLAERTALGQFTLSAIPGPFECAPVGR
jgi:hypothetical protein